MRYSVEMLVKRIGGRIEGNPAIEVRGVNTLDQAGPDELSFVTNARYKKLVSSTRAAVLLVPCQGDWPSGITLIVHETPYVALARALALFHPAKTAPEGIDAASFIGKDTTVGKEPSIAPLVSVGRGCTIGDRVRLDPGVVIGDGVVMGDDVHLYPNVTVYSGSVMGARVTVHAGSVIGSDGFGYAKDGQAYLKVPQVGSVIIGDDVEIGSNVSIDRGTIGATIIGDGVKIDNLIQIAHNVEIGRNTVIAALTGISGSAKVGAGVTFAGQVGTAGHVTIGDGCVITGKTGVTKDIPAGKIVSGTPAVDHNRWRRGQVLVNRLPELAQRVKELEAQVRSLKSSVESEKSSGSEDET